MRRLLAALALAALSLAGPAASAPARKAPPRHRHAARHHKHHARKHRKHRRHSATHKSPTAPTPHTTATPTAPATTPPVPAPIGSLDPAPGDTITPPATTPPPAPPPHALGIVQGDAAGGRFSLTLTRTLLGAGSEVVQVRNSSQDAHDLHIDTLAGTPAVSAWDPIESGDPAVTRTVTLAPGTYRVYCSLPGHAALGMDTQITVSG